ncbi:MAG: hypothetical protein CENE_01207 [Candidatus Celerinatantimonas neptuna]|nr:MAG: hypothetical protein CENE_01207 [Candidatus Celerinatantimonas neptuna]
MSNTKFRLSLGRIFAREGGAARIKTMTMRAVAHAYDRYYRIGLYRKRYPSANPKVLKILRQLCQSFEPEQVILDFGCGWGRYLLPLRQLTQATLIGHDISEVALSQLHHQLKGLSSTCEPVLLTHNEAELKIQLDLYTGASLIYLLFGVLAHIPSRAQREYTLRFLYQQLDPLQGRMVLSVPNRYRRFLRLQLWGWLKKRFNRSADIVYSREDSGQLITLPYHLYSPAEFIAELQSAGFEIERFEAESLFSEHGILHYPFLGTVDRCLCKLMPVCLGYGLLAVVRKKTI